MEMFKENQAQKSSIRDFVAVLFKHRRKVLLFSLLIIFPVIIGTLLAPKVYETEAKLFVRMGREVLTSNASTGEQIQISQSMENQLNSEIEILQSRQMARNVVNVLGTDLLLEGRVEGEGAQDGKSWVAVVRERIDAVISFPKQAVARFLTNPDEPSEIERKMEAKAIDAVMESLGITSGTESNVITITYEADNPYIAKRVLSTLIDLYLEKHIELHGSPGSYEFFKRETLLLQEQLENAETELKEVKNEIGIGNLEEQRSILSEQIGALQVSKEETESDIASSEARIAILQNRFKDVPQQVVVSETTGFARSAAEEMSTRINELKLQEQELLSTFTENSIPVKEVRRQINEAESLLEKAAKGRQVTMGLNAIHQDLNLTLLLENGTIEALRAKKAAIDRQLEAAKSELRSLNDAELRLGKLQRRKDLLEQNFLKFDESREQTRIDQAREMEKISNISIAQAPVLPVDPVSPNVRLNLLFGMFLAVFGGLGLAFFMEYMDDRLDKPEQVETVLELPVLGSIRKLER